MNAHKIHSINVKVQNAEHNKVIQCFRLGSDFKLLCVCVELSLWQPGQAQVVGYKIVMNKNVKP
jgi:hypothetical protein